MKNIYTVSLLLFAVSLCFAKTDPRKIMENANEASRIKGSESVSTLTIIDSKGRKRVRKTAQITKLYNKGKTEKRLIRFLSPADVKGTGFLMFDYESKDDDMWLFMPALRKTRRIISSEKAKNFMGSEFSYADMSRPKLDDFNFKLLKEEKANGVLCWVIEIKPKNEDVADENGFSKKIAYISKKNNVMRKSIYYDLDESLLKETNVYKVKELDKKNHKFRLTHMFVENKQSGRKSEVKVEKLNFLPNAKDSYFNTRALEKQ